MWQSAREPFRFEKQIYFKNAQHKEAKSITERNTKPQLKKPAIYQFKMRRPQEFLQESLSNSSISQQINTLSNNQTTLNTDTIIEEDENPLQNVKVKKNQIFQSIIGFQSPSDVIKKSFGQHPGVNTPKELKRALRLTDKVQKFQSLYFDRNLNNQNQMRSTLTPRTIKKLIQRRNKFKLQLLLTKNSTYQQKKSQDNLYFIPIEYLSSEGYGFKKFTQQLLETKKSCDFRLSKNVKRNLIRKITEQYFS